MEGRGRGAPRDPIRVVDDSDRVAHGGAGVGSSCGFRIRVADRPARADIAWV